MKVKLLLSFLLLVGCCLCAAPADRAKTPPARQAWDAYVMSYWLPEKAQFRLHKGREDKLLDFWFAAHAWDAIIDASLKFNDARTKAMVPAFYDAFMKRYPDWKTNHFNDDILWWTISCTYAYRHTHDKRYLEQAKTMFDWLCEKEIDDTLGGGMWWKNSEHKSKNACNNFPAVITAMNLYAITKEKKYLETAKKLHDWSREKFFDTNSGAVYDNINLDGKVTRWNFSYNIGTFIGASLRMAKFTGEKKYLADAVKAGEQLTKDLSPNGILKASGQGDGGAFNGIGVRYLAELAKIPEGHKFKPWLKENAKSAWEHRRPCDNIIGNDWSKTPADDFDIEGQTAISALTLLLLAP